MEKPNFKPMTKTELEMAKLMIQMLDTRAKKTKKNDAWFEPLNFVLFCEELGINRHKSRSYIKILHLSGHLNRRAVNKVGNEYTLNPDSKEMMGIIDSLISKPVKRVSKNMPIGNVLIKKEAAVAISIQEYVTFAKTLSPTAPAALGDNDSFKAKSALDHLIRHSVCKHHTARYYIRYLHGRGFLERIKRGWYRVASVNSTKKPKKVTPKVVKVSEPSKEIKQIQKKCLRVTYGEKQMLNKIENLERQVLDLNQVVTSMHMTMSEMLTAVKEKPLNLSNLFKRKMVPKTQLMKG